jgi:drug/metabolite transporter (DMT)-like permease
LEQPCTRCYRERKSALSGNSSVRDNIDTFLNIFVKKKLAICAVINCWVLAFILDYKLSLDVFSFDLVGSLLYLGVFASAVCFSIQNIGKKYDPAATASILLSIESVFGVIFAIALLGESSKS